MDVIISAQWLFIKFIFLIIRKIGIIMDCTGIIRPDSITVNNIPLPLK